MAVLGVSVARFTRRADRQLVDGETREAREHIPSALNEIRRHSEMSRVLDQGFTDDLPDAAGDDDSAVVENHHFRAGLFDFRQQVSAQHDRRIATRWRWCE